MQIVNKIKKASMLVAVVGAGLSFATSAHAGVTPYKSSFEPIAPATDTPKTNYLPGNLAGQGGFQDLNASGGASVVPSAGIPGVTAANGLQVVKLQGTPGNIIDFGSTNNVYSTGEMNALGNVLNVSFDASHGAAAGGSQSRFGIEILSTPDINGNNSILASLYLGEDTVASNPSGPYVPTLFVGNQAVPFGINDTGNGGGGVARSDGAWGTYNLKLDLNNDTFSFFVNGNNANGGTYNFFNPSGGAVGGVAFASYGESGDVAYFDNLSVVPEPAMCSMIGVGAMMLLSKRPRRA